MATADLTYEAYLDRLAEKRVYRDDALARLAGTLLDRGVSWSSWYEHREHLLTWPVPRLVELAYAVHQGERHAA